MRWTDCAPVPRATRPTRAREAGPTMSDWLSDLADDALAGDCVLIGVTSTRGSCPREAGTRMLVAPGSSRGTIGGGHLEFQAIDIARQMLASAHEPGTPPRLERFALGARLGQCCGGLVQLSFERVPAERPPWIAHLLAIRAARRSAIIVTRIDARQGSAPGSSPGSGEHRQIRRIVELAATDGTTTGPGDGEAVEAPVHALATDCWHRAESHARALLLAPSPPSIRWESPFLYEPFAPDRFDIHLFGAGHVGQALIDVLHPLPCSITWIDSRASQFPARYAGNVRPLHSDRPEDEVDDAPAGSYLIVMTHSHALDLAICERALRRPDIAWCGLIGSATKRRRFERRLLARKFEPSDLARLTCPIGIDGIDGKHPAEIAIAVAADVLRARQRRQAIASPAHRAA